MRLRTCLGRHWIKKWLRLGLRLSKMSIESPPRSCSFTTLSRGGRPRNNDDAAHSRSVVGESGAAEGGDMPSPQNPNGALSLLLSIHSQHLLGSDPIRRLTNSPRMRRAMNDCFAALDQAFPGKKPSESLSRAPTGNG